jgi:uncharacterized protein (TIGR02453 family)
MTTAEAPSFSPGLFAFLRELKQHNEREWFNANKARYEDDLKEPALAFIEDMAYRLPEVAPELTADKRALFRIYRDTRFAKDKTPYKTNQGVVIHPADRGGALYLQVDASGLFVAGGRWHLEPDEVRLFRTRVADARAGARLTEILATLTTAGYRISEPELQRVPSGFDAEHPRADLLRSKRLTAARSFGSPSWLPTSRTAAEVTKAWRTMAPLLDWLDEL